MERVYYVTQALYNISMFSIGTTYVLFLRGEGLSHFTIGLINIVCIVAGVVADVPTGAWADKMGRKKVYVFGCWIIAIASFVYCFSTTGFLSLALVASHWFGLDVSEKILKLVLFWMAEILCGIGGACSHGALTAYVVDHLKSNGQGSRIGKVLNMGYLVKGLSGVVGGLIGSYFGKYGLHLPFGLMGIGTLVLGVYTQISLDEQYAPGSKEVRSWRFMIDGVKDIWSNKAIMLLVIFALINAFGTQVFVKLWTPYMEKYLTSQEQFGWAWAFMSTGMSISSYIASHLSKNHFRYFFQLQLMFGASLIGCVVLPFVPLKVLMLVMIEFGVGARGLYDTELNKRIDSSRRATTLSACGTIVSIGSVMGLAIGFAADNLPMTIVWTIAGLIVVFSSWKVGGSYLHLKNSST